MSRICPSCHRESPVESDFCPACGAPMNEHALRGQKKAAVRALDDPPMKWHKFLTWISLPLSIVMAVVGLVSAWQTLSSFDPSLFVPEYLPAVRLTMYLDLAVNALMLPLLGIAEYGLLTMRRIGVRALLALYGIQVVYAAVLLALLVRVKGDPLQAAVSIVSSGVILALTAVYYKKRQRLFS